MVNRFLFLFLSLFVMTARVAVADTVNISLPVINTEENWFVSTALVSNIIKDATSQALIRAGGSPAGSELEHVPFELEMADSFRLNLENGLISLRIKPGALFSNNKPVSAEDINFSLSRCAGMERLNLFKRFELREEVYKGIPQYWVDFEYARKISSEAELAPFFAQIAACRVFEADSSRVFGDYFGTSNNYISNGPYKITDLVSGRKIRLKPARKAAKAPSEQLPALLEISSYKEIKSVINALRIGSVDLFFTADENDHPINIYDSAAKDPTLGVGMCYGVKYIKRSSLTFSCDEKGINFRDFGY